MISNLINFILDLLGINRETKKEKELNSKKEELENKLEDIENSELDTQDTLDYLNE
jgi:uncharacterized protein YlxW (UPF0749 family)